MRGRGDIQISSQPGGKGGPRAKPDARKAQLRQVWAAGQLHPEAVPGVPEEGEGGRPEGLRPQRFTSQRKN